MGKKAVILILFILPLFSEVKYYPGKSPLISISLISPCGRADDEKSGVLEEFFVYHKMKWEDEVFSVGGRSEYRVGPDYSYFRVFTLKNYWQTAIKTIVSMVRDRGFESESLLKARTYLSLRNTSPLPRDFGIFLFYPLSRYAKPYPGPSDFNRISTVDLVSIRRKCFSPSRVRIVVEGSYLGYLVKERLTFPVSIEKLPPLEEPPDRTPLKVGLLPSHKVFVIWYFKVIDPKDLCPLRYLLSSLAMEPGGLLRSVLRPFGKVDWGINYGRKISVGWIMVRSIPQDAILKTISAGTRAIAGKLRVGLDGVEYERITRQFQGRAAYENSLPWQGFRREWKSFLMENGRCSRLQVNSSLSDYPTRSISVLVGASEKILPVLVGRFSSVGVFDRRGKLLYQVSR